MISGLQGIKDPTLGGYTPARGSPSLLYKLGTGFGRRIQSPAPVCPKPKQQCFT
jgi:hypothetical protein